MSIKLALLKTISATALAGLGAHLAQKNAAAGTRKAKRRGNCTPCAAMAMVDRSRQSVKTGQL